MTEIEDEIIVEFYDTDCMGVVWNGTYFNYFEKVRSKLFRANGYDYSRMYSEGFLLPLVRNSAKYIHPLRLGERAIIKATVTECEYMLEMKYEIREKDSGKLLTKGKSQQMATDLEGNGLGMLPKQFAASFQEGV